MPQRRTSINTCPLSGAGVGRSTTVNWPSLQFTAFIGHPRRSGSPRRAALDGTSCERVVVEVEAGAAPGRLEREAGPERRVAVLVEVVAVRVRAGSPEEDLVVAAPEHRLEVATVGLEGDLHARGAFAARPLQAAHDVAHLGLDQTEVGLAVESVGTEDRERVGKAGDAHALIGLQPVG